MRKRKCCAPLVPVSQTSFMMHPPRPLKGVSRGVVKRDEVRRPRASSQRGTRAAVELLSGPLGVPARSWLKARPTPRCVQTGLKQGPLPENAAKEHALTLRCLSACGAPEGASMPQGTSHKDFALFGAPSPLTPDAENASRQGERMSALCLPSANEGMLRRPAQQGRSSGRS